MTESNFSKELTAAVNTRKEWYAQLGKHDQTNKLRLDEPLSANESMSVRIGFWLDPTFEPHKRMLDVFARFQLTHENPMHWRLLLESFAEVGLKTSGPKNKVVSNKYSTLADHIRTLVVEDPKLKSPSQIARRLQSDKRYKVRYASIKFRTLRGHVTAFSWRHGTLEENLRVLREEMEKENKLALNDPEKH